MQTEQKSPPSCLDANKEQAARYERFMCTLAACVAEIITAIQNEEKEGSSPLRTDSICWDCANATVPNCPWIRQQEHVWDSAVTEVTVNGLRHKVVRCGNYVPDTVASEEMRAARRPLAGRV